MAHHHHHAVVVGAGVAGLLTAQALCRHFAYVTIVERDRLPADPRGRPGQQPGDRPQLLLRRGRTAIDRLVPGFVGELVELGAVELSAASDLCWPGASGRLTEPIPDQRVVSATNRLIEWHLRRRVLESGSIAVLEGRPADGLLPGWDGGRVSGVHLRDLDGRPGAPPALRADLVVDASGLRSPLPMWLERIGFWRPDEVTSEPWLAYASRLYRAPGRNPAWKGAFVHDRRPDAGRAGAVLEVEGSRLLVALQGVGGDHPSGDEAGFADFARSLPNPMVFDVIRDAEPLTPITTYAGIGARHRRVGRTRRWPDRLVSIGDSAWTFDPIEDQGVTSAALTAVRLDEVLRRRGARSLDGLAARFPAHVAAACRAARGELCTGRWTVARPTAGTAEVLDADDRRDSKVVAPLVG